MDDSHREALDEATADDERWESLAGHLYDPARPGQAPPDDICKKADRLVVTDHGRLFYCCADGSVSERYVEHSDEKGRRLDIVVDGTRWRASVDSLIARIWPGAMADTPDVADADEWAEWYDEEADDEREWLGALAEKKRPDDAGIVHRPQKDLPHFFRNG